MGPYLPNYSPSFSRDYGNLPSTSSSSLASSLGSIPPLTPADIRVVRAAAPFFSGIYYDSPTRDNDSTDHVNNGASDQEPPTTQPNISDQTNGEHPPNLSAFLQMEPEPESGLQPGFALQWAVIQALINVGNAARERRGPHNQTDGLCRACQRSLALDDELDRSEDDEELAQESQREPRPSPEPARELGPELEPGESGSAAPEHDNPETAAPELEPQPEPEPQSEPQPEPQHQLESEPPAHQRHSKTSKLLRRLLKKKPQTGTSFPPDQQVPLPSQSQAQPPSPQLGPRSSSKDHLTLKSKIKGTIRKLLPFKKKQKPQDFTALPPPMLAPEFDLGEPRVVIEAEGETEPQS